MLYGLDGRAKLSNAMQSESTRKCWRGWGCWRTACLTTVPRNVCVRFMIDRRLGSLPVWSARRSIDGWCLPPKKRASACCLRGRKRPRVLPSHGDEHACESS